MYDARFKSEEEKAELKQLRSNFQKTLDKLHRLQDKLPDPGNLNPRMREYDAVEDDEDEE